MPRRLPPLNALRAFEAAARCASFTRAAEELFVTQGAVSRHIATLEAWSRAPLFDRTRHGIALTARGQAYFGTVRAALDQIEHATRQLLASPDEQLLRIKLPPTFAIRWLVPRLAQFHALHQGIDVQITTSHQRADFAHEDVDVSIYGDTMPPSAAGGQLLFGAILLPVCAPGLLKKGPALATPSDLARHVLLCSMNTPHDWPTWFAAAQVVGLDGNSGLKFENAALAYQAAVDRLGVMIATRAFVEDDLAARRLTAPFALQAEARRGYFLAYRAQDPLPSRVRAFVDWITKEAAGQSARSASQGLTALKKRRNSS
jgi:LysR family glycine cleavage system transcriptional activator